MISPSLLSLNEEEYVPGDHVPIIVNQKKDGTFIEEWIETDRVLRPGTLITKRLLKELRKVA